MGENQMCGLKARDMKAQGNALGKANVLIPSPERASQTLGYSFVLPFQGKCHLVIKPRALPWAIMSLRFQRDKTANSKTRKAGSI